MAGAGATQPPLEALGDAAPPPELELAGAGATKVDDVEAPEAVFVAGGTQSPWAGFEATVDTRGLDDGPAVLVPLPRDANILFASSGSVIPSQKSGFTVPQALAPPVIDLRTAMS